MSRKVSASVETEAHVLLIFCPYLLPARLIFWLVKRLKRRAIPQHKSVIKQNAFTDSCSYKNLVIYSGRNTTFTEIDEVIASPYGIFCVEEKGHQGYVFGSYNKKFWTQCRYDGKRAMYNPLWQNYKHIKSLELLLGRNIKEPVHSFVVFTNAKEVEVDDPRVLKGWGSLTKELWEHEERIYADQEMNISVIFFIAPPLSVPADPRGMSQN